jgi:hypothetical protein
MIGSGMGRSHSKSNLPNCGTKCRFQRDFFLGRGIRCKEVEGTYVHFATYFPSGCSSGETLLEDLPVVLIIEDDYSIQSMVEDALSEGGFESAVAASGEEAVTLLKGRMFRTSSGKLFFRVSFSLVLMYKYHSNSD